MHDQRVAAAGDTYHEGMSPGRGPAAARRSAAFFDLDKTIIAKSSSLAFSKPFQAGGLIPGWVEALKLMKTPHTWEIAVPADLGYGSDGAGDAIPPDQTLVFTMTLAKVEYAP